MSGMMADAMGAMGDKEFQRARSLTTPNLEQIIAKCADHLSGFTPAEFAAHVVAAIRDSGLAVIALPEPTGSDDTGRHEWLDGEVCVGAPGNGRVRCYIEDPRMTDDDARDLAAALLAAAQVAERNTP